MKQGPRFLDEDEVESAPPDLSPILSADGEPHAATSQGPIRPMLLDEEPDAPTRLANISPPKGLNSPTVRVGSSVLIACGLGGLFLSWALLSLLSFVLVQLQLSLFLGAVSGVCVVVCLGLLGWAVGIEMRAWRALSDVDRLRSVLSAHLAERDAVVTAAIQWLALVTTNIPESSRLERAIQSAETSGEVRALLRTQVAEVLQARAIKLGQRAATECAALISICPRKGWDGLVVGARSLRLIRQIASLYGMRPGMAVTVSLIRHVAWTATGTAVTIALTETALKALAEAPIVTVAAEAVSASALEAVRMIRLSSLAARSCCPLDAR